VCLYVFLLIAAILSCVLTPLVRSVARWVGVVDQPGGRKIHAVPTPRLGRGQCGGGGGADDPERLGPGAGHEWGSARGAGSLEAGVPGRSHCLSPGCVG
jgi:hypothetical protein